MSLLSFVESLPEFLLSLTAKATVLLVVAWLVARGLCRSSAAIRHRLWSLRSGRGPGARTPRTPGVPVQTRSTTFFQTTVSRTFPDEEHHVFYPLEELKLSLSPGETRTLGLGPLTKQQRADLERRREATRAQAKKSDEFP